jgi:plasmid stability protein
MSLSASTLVVMSSVHLPDELVDRLVVEAARRGVTVDELSAELVAAGLPAEGEPDPLEAFIGSGHSGRGDLGRSHREIKTEITDGLAARDL